MKKLLNLFLVGLISLSMVSFVHSAQKEIGYADDITGNQGFVQGSDGRLNTSSRSDSRAYYNSRDVGRTFSLVWNNTNSSSGKHVVYWKNTSTTRDLVISSIGFNSDINANFELNFVTGTAAGTSATPTNLNQSSGKTAAAVAFHNADVTGLTVSAEIDHAYVVAGGHEELRLGDRVRLGQDDAIAVRIETSFGAVGAPIHTAGVIFGYYETPPK